MSSCLGFAFVPIWTGLSWGGGRCSGAHAVGTGDRSGVLAVAVAMTAVPLLLLVAVPLSVVVAVVESRWVVAGVTAGVGIGHWEWR